MKSKFILVSLILLVVLPIVSALTIQPSSLHINQSVQTNRLYISEEVNFETTCVEWFSYDAKSRTVSFSYDAGYTYSECHLYFASKRGIEIIKIPVLISDAILVVDESEFNSTNISPSEYVVLSNLTTGDEGEKMQFAAEIDKITPSAQFIGTVHFPKFNPSTLGGILITIFFVSVVFLLIPKT